MSSPRAPQSRLALIVAWALVHGADPGPRVRLIGRDGGMPWHEPEDLKHFKRTTAGHPIVMGRKTHASIGRPLPGRRNLVVTRNPAFEAPGCEVATSLEQALEAARRTDDCPFVIGGAAIYAAALPHATTLHVTEIEPRGIGPVRAGDVLFPTFDEAAWIETSRRPGADGRLVFRVLERAGRAVLSPDPR